VESRAVTTRRDETAEQRSEPPDETERQRIEQDAGACGSEPRVPAGERDDRQRAGKEGRKDGGPGPATTASLSDRR